MSHLVIDNYGSNIFFNSLEDALIYMRNSGKYDKKYFARCYAVKEVFNSDNFDMVSIREKEIKDGL